jgi:hypothetical protein
MEKYAIRRGSADADPTEWRRFSPAMRSCAGCCEAWLIFLFDS